NERINADVLSGSLTVVPGGSSPGKGNRLSNRGTKLGGSFGAQYCSWPLNPFGCDLLSLSSAARIIKRCSACSLLSADCTRRLCICGSTRVRAIRELYHRE